MHIENWSAERDPKLELFECVYFIVTTMTTVGYGDISPSTNLAMAFTCGLMVYLVLILFPSLVDSATDYARVTPFNSSPASYEYQPVILWQAKGEIPCDKLHGFARELFSEDADQKVSLCVVGDNPPSEEMEAYINIPRAETIVYIEGNLNNNDVADRAGIQYAKACVLMHADDCPTDELVEQDERICIMGMRLRQFTMDESIKNGWDTHPCRVILSLNTSYNQVYFKSGFFGATPIDHKDTFEAMSIQELQMACFAKNIICPGFHPFLANMASIRGEVIDGESREEGMEMLRKEDDPWIFEYFTGLENECYKLKLPSHLHKLLADGSVTLPQISACLYYETGLSMFRYRDLQGRRGHEQTFVKIVATEWENADDCLAVLAKLTKDSILNHDVWQGSDIELPAEFHPKGNKQEPLPEAVVKDRNLELVYKEAGLMQACGTLEHFSMRHHVQDPNLRAEEDVTTFSCQFQVSASGQTFSGFELADVKAARQELEQPALIQPVGSPTLMALEDHVVVISQSIEHVSEPACFASGMLGSGIEECMLVGCSFCSSTPHCGHS